MRVNTPANMDGRNEGYPECIQPFRISQEPVAWPWCNLASSQGKPYCTPVNSHSPVGLVSRQWDAVEWACVLHERRIHKSPTVQRRFCIWEKPKVAGSQIWTVGDWQTGWCDALPKKKSLTRAGQAHCLDEADLLARSLWMWRSHSTQAQSTASHCRLTSPTGEWLFTDAQ